MIYCCCCDTERINGRYLVLEPLSNFRGSGRRNIDTLVTRPDMDVAESRISLADCTARDTSGQYGRWWIRGMCALLDLDVRLSAHYHSLGFTDVLTNTMKTSRGCCWSVGRPSRFSRGEVRPSQYGRWRIRRTIRFRIGKRCHGDHSRSKAGDLDFTWCCTDD